MTLSELRTKIKAQVTHSPTGIDAVVDVCINTAIEAFTQNVAAIYDEDIWNHQFTAGDVSNNYDNWTIPSNTKYIRKAAYRDVSGTEDTYEELRIVSPDNIYNYNNVDAHTSRGFVGGGGEDFSGAIRMGIFDSYSRRGYGATRTDAEGKPRICYRLQNSIFVHPRPSTAEVGNWIELYIQKYVAALSADGDSNTISINYPYALIHYAVGILWATKLGNLPRAQASLQLGAGMLTSVATAQEISKLVGIELSIN